MRVAVLVRGGLRARRVGLGVAHERRRVLRQHRVFGHADDMLDAFGVPEAEQRRIGELAVESNAIKPRREAALA